MDTINFSKLKSDVSLVGTITPPEEVAELYQSLVKQVEALHEQPILASVDLSKLLDRLGQLGIVGLIDDSQDPRRVSPHPFAHIVSNLGAHVGFSQGTVLALNLVGTRFEVLSADIQPEKISRYTYLGSPLIVAEVMMRVPNRVESGGFSLQNLALYDPERTAQDSRNGLQMLEISRGQMAEVPFAQPIYRRIVSNRVTTEEYAYVCGVIPFKMEEVQHSKDHIFRDLAWPQEANPAMRLMTAVREGSKLHDIINGTKAGYRQDLLLGGIAEYCGALGGTIMAMTTHLADDRPDRALLTFDDFLWMSNMRAVFSEAGAYNIEATLFFTRLADLIGEQKISPAGLSGLLGAPSVAVQAENSLDMLRAVYRGDFYEDDERQQILNKRAQDAV